MTRRLELNHLIIQSQALSVLLLQRTWRESSKKSSTYRSRGWPSRRRGRRLSSVISVLWSCILSRLGGCNQAHDEGDTKGDFNPLIKQENIQPHITENWNNVRQGTDRNWRLTVYARKTKELINKTHLNWGL